MNYFQNIGVNLAIRKNEKILWAAKPYKKCFVLESIFNPFLIFSIFWRLFDFAFFSLFFHEFRANSGARTFLLIFCIIHLMPVWLYIGGVLFTFQKYKNSEFAITDKAIYVSGGSLRFYSKIEKYYNVQSVQLRRGLIDQILDVGDVVITLKTKHLQSRGSKHSNDSYVIVNDKIEIIDVHDYRNVIDLIQNQIELRKAAKQQV